MEKRLPNRPLGAILLFLGLASALTAQANLTLNDVLEKNILAAGGREKLSAVKNLSFKTGTMRCFAASTGELKMMTGKEPVVTEVILVGNDGARRNSFNVVSDLTGIRKAANQVLAKLYAGVFTLQKFEKELSFQGLKAYGPEKFFLLTAKSDPLEVEFFVRADDFCLKRLVFSGLTPEREKYEVNYDFGPFEDADGLKIPLSWFSSQVGTRGTLIEISDFKINQPLEAGFFTNLDINIGRAEAGPGSLKGNILDFGGGPMGYSITTNWTKTDIDKAGFKSGDRLALSGEGFSEEITFYASAQELPPQDVLAKGGRFLSPAPRGGEVYFIQFFAVDTAQMAAKLRTLAPIEIEKK